MASSTCTIRKRCDANKDEILQDALNNNKEIKKTKDRDKRNIETEESSFNDKVDLDVHVTEIDGIIENSTTGCNNLVNSNVNVRNENERQADLTGNATTTMIPGTIASKKGFSNIPKGNTSDIRKVAGSGCDLWGTQRLELAKIVRDYMQNYNECSRKNEDPTKTTFILRDVCIENGTLLGAWRSGKFIPHDDDFDFAMFIDLLPTGDDEKDACLAVENKSGAPLINSSELDLDIITNGVLPITAKETDVARELRTRFVLEQINAYLDACLEEDGLTERYATRIITSYGDKIEVFEPKYGDFVLPSEFYGDNARFHYVTVDLQPYVGIGGQGKGMKMSDDNQVVYRAPYRANSCPWHALKTVDVIPTDVISLEGEMFPAPRNVEAVLTHMYGYLGHGAVYNKATQKYEKDE